MIKKYFLTVLFFLFRPAFALAVNLSQTYENTLNPIPDQQLFCPTPVCDLLTLFLLILRDILRLIPIFSVLFIIIGGFKMISAAGNEEKYIEAKRTIVWAVLGLVVAVLAFSIIAIVQNFLSVQTQPL